MSKKYGSVEEFKRQLDDIPKEKVVKIKQRGDSLSKALTEKLKRDILAER